MQNIDINKIKSITFVAISLFMVSVICPGILFVFTFNKELFINTDVFKLVLLCISITFPVWLLNSMFMLYIIHYDSPKELKNEDLQLLSIIGSFLTIPVIYSPILIKMFFDISIQISIMINLTVELIILLSWLINKLAKK